MITIYSKPNCPHCVAAKMFLENHNIPFQTVDVTQDEAALEFIRGRGHKTVPQLYVGESLLVEGGNSSLQKLSPDEIRDRVNTLLG